MSALRRSRVREIGQYEVLQRLRSGGMATLYLALRRREDGISEKVAIKVIHDHLADRPEFLAMFETEAQIQSRIHHPNVVEVEEFGTTDDDEPFLVMQWVDGASVAQLLTVLHRREAAMPIELAVRIAMEVAAGLHAAHALADDEGRPLGVVHRDVSPDNVLLSRAGEIKLIDFGVAKVRTGLRTMTGVLKGKVRYMSPEQARSGPVDARTDVYALGVVLWEMLTTRRLFEEADHVLALEAVRRSAIAPPSVYRSEIPAALDAVVMSALRAHPAERPASADELRRALARVVPGALALAPASITSLLVASGLVEPPPIEPDTDLHATSELLPSPTAPEIVVPSDDSGAFTWQRLAPLRVEPGDWVEVDSEVVDTNELPRPPQL
ncbi:MAG: protein kinase, partial [Sandaracinaceae bacterium]|nr:protein kinase [Sandaracinaceae bacterium]